jgi:hypothetical protein
VVKKAGLMLGIIPRSVGGTTSRSCGQQVAKQAGLTLGTIQPSAGGNISTHCDVLKLLSSLDF